MQRLVPRKPLPLWQGFLIALGATGVAWGGRAALAPVIADQSPYPLFFVAVLVTGLMAGWQSASVAAIVGGFIANRSFVPPYGHLALGGKFGWGFALYVLTVVLIIWLTQSVRFSIRREAALSDNLAMVGKEYRHRIKNLLAMSQALVQQTGRFSSSISEFQEAILDRLQALARAQDLLSVREDERVPLGVLLGEILKPFNVERRLTTPLDGPGVDLAPDQAIALALLLNELATNATKYGALSVPEGRLSLAWTVRDSRLVLTWQEREGPTVTSPTKRGFGSRLIEQAMPRSLGRATVRYEPDGVRCEINLTV